MLSGKRKPDQENFVDTSMLLDAVTSLIDAFKQAGYNSPTSIQVDKQAFYKLLEEASKLYSSINVRDSIVNKEFSLANIIDIVLEGGKEKEVDKRHRQKQKDIQQAITSTEDNQVKHQLPLSSTTTKYECPNCGATFDTPGGHRKHYQAFHEGIEEPKVIKQAEI